MPMKMAENATTGTVRGNVIDTSEAQLPIQGVRAVIVGVSGLENEAETDSNGEYEIVGLAPGRYLLSIYRDGYGDRTDKPVTVVAGGDHYVPLKMTKIELITLWQKKFGWLLILCLAVALGFIIGRRTGHRSD